jgi:L-ascorbate metabolism protein UlaG (beta-lactamase superfamily)
VRILLASVLGLLSAVAGGWAQELRFTFIGNMAFAITDGRTTLYTDFPYQSGYSVYMTYEFDAVPKVSEALCLVTHGHPDHFEPGLFARMDAKLIAPRSVEEQVPADRVIPLARRMTYRDIEIEAFPTKHHAIEHYSYLVTWHGRRLYFTGDTDSTDQLLAMRDLDVAFVSPWLMELVAEKKGRVDARKVVCYHQTFDEKVPAFQDRLVLKQGGEFVLPAAPGPQPAP